MQLILIRIPLINAHLAPQIITSFFSRRKYHLTEPTHVTQSHMWRNMSVSVFAGRNPQWTTVDAVCFYLFIFCDSHLCVISHLPLHKLHFNRTRWISHCVTSQKVLRSRQFEYHELVMLNKSMWHDLSFVTWSVTVSCWKHFGHKRMDSTSNSAQVLEAVAFKWCSVAAKSLKVCQETPSHHQHELLLQGRMDPSLTDVHTKLCPYHQ